MMPTINMLSSADKVKGQGVGSAYLEQVRLVREGLGDEFDIKINDSSYADIMHYHTIDPKHYVSMLASKKKDAITVAAVHFLPETLEGSLKLPKIPTKVFYEYIIKFYKEADYLVTVNPIFIDKLVAYGIDKSKIKYIPNYVSKENFYEMNEDEILKLKEKHGIAKDKFTVLCAGQLQTRKGIFDFIEIAKQMPDVQFVWAGGFSFGNITAGYKDVKEILENHPDNVKFTGIVDRSVMNELYNIANVMFLPSYSELFPMIILEAMNCGTPLLLRDLDIYPDILFDFYLKGNNNEEFINQINKLKNDKKFYETCSSKSRTGSEFYSKENVLRMWEEYYNTILHHSN